MQKFSFQAELQKIISSKQLAEIRFQSKPDLFNVAYILSANEVYLTLAEIDPKAHFDGVCIYQVSDLSSIKVDTEYLKKFGKKIKDDGIYQRAIQGISTVKEFTFQGFISAFENTDTYVEILCGRQDTPAGKIVGHDEAVIVLDEISGKKQTSFTKTYIVRSTITRLSVDVPWVNKITQY